ncbi:MAG: hypothetical protein RBS39_04375 [Phycisphaerales bacterium]|jgi:lipid-binding SYLF domain-containing protein|nr:hypothetical protein [Phycisphaerales bacterium]
MRIVKHAALALALFAPAALVACAGPKGDTVAEQQKSVKETRDETLKMFYDHDASLKGKVSKAAGYGVFSNVGVKVIFVSGGGGYGVVHNNKSKKDTYMKMGEAGVGLGLGVKDFRALFIFKDESTLQTFIDKGWEFGAEADAAAKSGDKGGAASGKGDVDSGIEIYQITESGLALSATIGGTKYWKDDKLND